VRKEARSVHGTRPRRRNRVGRSIARRHQIRRFVRKCIAHSKASHLRAAEAYWSGPSRRQQTLRHQCESSLANRVRTPCDPYSKNDITGHTFCAVWVRVLRPRTSALRAIPIGRKSWNFCWTELGAKHVGIAQSLMVTCRLHGIDPYTYLVDVLQRVGQHPAACVAELTPRLWKQHFANDPLRSGLHQTGCSSVPTAYTDRFS
jgi:hypothetical protein